MKFKRLRSIAALAAQYSYFLPRDTRMKLFCFISRSAPDAVRRYGFPYGFKSSLTELCRQMRRALFKYGLYYEEFMLYDCAGKDDGYLISFVSEIGRWKYFDRYNDKSERELFRNKNRVYARFRPYFKREATAVRSKSDFSSFADFVSRHGKFIVKPADKSCGYGVKLYDAANYRDLHSLFDAAFEKGTEYICEQLIEQSEETAAFNQTSVNTVRYVNNPTQEQKTAFTPFFRMGRYGREVDNAGAGGIFTSVDIHSGRIGAVARDENGAYYKKHPDSGVKFDGFVLPEWEHAKKLVAELESAPLKSRLISWDLAYTKNDGWVLVEANYAGQFICQQSVIKSNNGLKK